MVTPDLNMEKESNKNKQQKMSLKEFGYVIQKRAYAFVLDLLVLYPVVSFILDVLVAVRGSVSVFGKFTFGFVLFSLMQALFILFFDGTPGQIVFKLRVCFENLGRDYFYFLKFTRAFLRQLLANFSVMLLSLPFLSLLTHFRGRAFYDRLVEADVVKRFGDEVRFGELDLHPAVLRSLVRFQNFGYLMLFVFASFFVTDKLSLFNSGGVGRSLASVSSGVGEANSYKAQCDIPSGFFKSTDMKKVVTMHSLDMITDDCLAYQAEKNINQSWSWVAKAVVETDPVVQEKYLEKFCETQSKHLLCVIEVRVPAGEKPVAFKDIVKGVLMSELTPEEKSK